MGRYTVGRYSEGGYTVGRYTVGRRSLHTGQEQKYFYFPLGWDASPSQGYPSIKLAAGIAICTAGRREVL